MSFKEYLTEAFPPKNKKKAKGKPDKKKGSAQKQDDNELKDNPNQDKELKTKGTDDGMDSGDFTGGKKDYAEDPDKGFNSKNAKNDQDQEDNEPVEGDVDGDGKKLDDTHPDGSPKDPVDPADIVRGGKPAKIIINPTLQDLMGEEIRQLVEKIADEWFAQPKSKPKGNTWDLRSPDEHDADIKAFKLGFEAGRTSKRHSANPYSKTSRQYDRWAAGLSFALKGGVF